MVEIIKKKVGLFLQVILKKDNEIIINALVGGMMDDSEDKNMWQ